ncbi:hypothetical protein C0995_012288 [Termitomyces sp. Mi166|nr:hypothetical protein C0995_012288 [Termitomyces sp. Mi166\
MHGSHGNIASIQDVDKDYRNFTRLSNALVVEPKQILGNDLNMCFYKGIPETLRKRIRKRMPVANQKTTNPPSVEQQLGWLRAEFDIDAGLSDVELDLDQTTSESEEDSEKDVRRDRRVKKGKRVKKSASFALEPSVESVPSANETEKKIDELTRGIEQLRTNCGGGSYERSSTKDQESKKGKAAVITEAAGTELVRPSMETRNLGDDPRASEKYITATTRAAREQDPPFCSTCEHAFFGVSGPDKIDMGMLDTGTGYGQRKMRDDMIQEVLVLLDGGGGARGIKWVHTIKRLGEQRGVKDDTAELAEVIKGLENEGLVKVVGST